MQKIFRRTVKGFVVRGKVYSETESGEDISERVENFVEASTVEKAKAEAVKRYHEAGLCYRVISAEPQNRRFTCPVERFYEIAEYTIVDDDEVVE